MRSPRVQLDRHQRHPKEAAAAAALSRWRPVAGSLGLVNNPILVLPGIISIANSHVCRGRVSKVSRMPVTLLLGRP